MNPIRVLHVDDEPAFGDLTSEYLEREYDGFDVVTEPSAADALARLDAADDAVDCLVSDYDMPRTDGLELLEAVRTDYPDLPFILFTGKGSEQVASDAIAAGATDYLQKKAGTEQFDLLANRIENAVEQYRSKRHLQRQKRQYQALFEQAPVMFAVFRDEDGEPIVEDCNDRFAEKLGYDVDFICGQPMREFFTAESVTEVFDEDGYQRTLDGEFDTEERTLLTSDGDHVDVLTRATPRLDETGSPTGALALYFDVTEQRERERALQRERDRVRALFENMAEPIAYFEFENGVPITKEVNPAFEETFGVSDAAARGQQLDDLVVPPAYVDEGADINARVRAGEIVDTEVVRTATDGLRTFNLLSVPLSPGEDGERGFAVYTDVTDRSERERELQRYQRLVETAADGIYVLDDDLRFSMVNEQMTSLTGHSREELLGAEFVSIVATDGTLAGEQARKRLLAGDRGVETVRADVHTADGDVVPCEFRFTVFSTDEGVSTVGVARDISDRKEREERLEAQSAAMEASMDGMAILDESGEYVYVNQAHADIYGYDDPDAFLGESWQMCYGTDELARMEQEVMPTLVEEGRWRGEGVGLRADGTTFPQELSLTLMEDGGYVCVVRDITDRKQREAQLHETNRELESILATTPALIFVKDRDGRYRRMNDTAKEVLSLDASDVEGMTDYDIFPDDVAAEFQADDRRVFESGKAIEHAEEVPTPDGTRTFLTLKSPIYEGETLVGLCGVAMDITERVEYEREIERQNERLDDFARIVSHDLRNPLHVAQGHLDIARDGDDIESKHLDTVADAHDRMEAIIQETLTLAREGRTVSDVEPISLETTADQSWETVDSGSASLEVTADVTILGDFDRVCHVFENLFRNAIEHGGEDVTVRVTIHEDGFAVADDGPGIPADDRESVFDPGYTTSESGTGFGLTIVADIVEAHGWEITVTESESGGARFDITGVERPS